MLLKMNIKFWLHSAMASFLFCNLLAIRTTKIGRGNVLTGIASNEMNPNLIFQYWWHNCTRVNSKRGPFELEIKSCLHIPLHRSLFTYELNINSGNQFKLLLDFNYWKFNGRIFAATICQAHRLFSKDSTFKHRISNHLEWYSH